MVGNKLVLVVVARQNVGFKAPLLGLLREGADQVVGFEARKLYNGDAHGLDYLAHAEHLAAQVVGHGGARGLVSRGFVVPEGSAFIEGHHHVLRGPLCEACP